MDEVAELEHALLAAVEEDQGSDIIGDIARRTTQKCLLCAGNLMKQGLHRSCYGLLLKAEALTRPEGEHALFLGQETLRRKLRIQTFDLLRDFEYSRMHPRMPSRGLVFVPKHPHPRPDNRTDSPRERRASHGDEEDDVEGYTMEDLPPLNVVQPRVVPRDGRGAQTPLPPPQPRPTRPALSADERLRRAQARQQREKARAEERDRAREEELRIRREEAMEKARRAQERMADFESDEGSTRRRGREQREKERGLEAEREKKRQEERRWQKRRRELEAARARQLAEQERNEAQFRRQAQRSADRNSRRSRSATPDKKPSRQSSARSQGASAQEKQTRPEPPASPQDVAGWNVSDEAGANVSDEALFLKKLSPLPETDVLTPSPPAPSRQKMTALEEAERLEAAIDIQRTYRDYRTRCAQLALIRTGPSSGALASEVGSFSGIQRRVSEPASSKPEKGSSEELVRGPGGPLGTPPLADIAPPQPPTDFEPASASPPPQVEAGAAAPEEVASGDSQPLFPALPVSQDLGPSREDVEISTVTAPQHPRRQSTSRELPPAPTAAVEVPPEGTTPPPEGAAEGGAAAAPPAAAEQVEGPAKDEEAVAPPGDKAGGEDKVEAEGETPPPEVEGVSQEAAVPQEDTPPQQLTQAEGPSPTSPDYAIKVPDTEPQGPVSSWPQQVTPAVVPVTVAPPTPAEAAGAAAAVPEGDKPAEPTEEPPPPPEAPLGPLHPQQPKNDQAPPTQETAQERGEGGLQSMPAPGEADPSQEPPKSEDPAEGVTTGTEEAAVAPVEQPGMEDAAVAPVEQPGSGDAVPPASEPAGEGEGAGVEALPAAGTAETDASQTVPAPVPEETAAAPADADASQAPPAPAPEQGPAEPTQPPQPPASEPHPEAAPPPSEEPPPPQQPPPDSEASLAPQPESQQPPSLPRQPSVEQELPTTTPPPHDPAEQSEPLVEEQPKAEVQSEAPQAEQKVAEEVAEEKKPGEEEGVAPVPPEAEQQQQQQPGDQPPSPPAPDTTAAAAEPVPPPVSDEEALLLLPAQAAVSAVVGCCGAAAAVESFASAVEARRDAGAWSIQRGWRSAIARDALADRRFAADRMTKSRLRAEEQEVAEIVGAAAADALGATGCVVIAAAACSFRRTAAQRNSIAVPPPEALQGTEPVYLRLVLPPGAMLGIRFVSAGDLRVLSVAEGSPAEAAGVRSCVGLRLLSISGVSIRDSHDCLEAMRATERPDGTRQLLLHLANEPPPTLPPDPADLAVADVVGRVPRSRPQSGRSAAQSSCRYTPDSDLVAALQEAYPEDPTTGPVDLEAYRADAGSLEAALKQSERMRAHWEEERRMAEELRAQGVAAVKIQSTWRGHHDRGLAGQLRARASIKLLRDVRRWRQERVQRAMTLVCTDAAHAAAAVAVALAIGAPQELLEEARPVDPDGPGGVSAWRSDLAARTERKQVLMAVTQAAALLMQAAARGWLARRRALRIKLAQESLRWNQRVSAAGAVAAVPVTGMSNEPSAPPRSPVHGVPKEAADAVRRRFQTRRLEAENRERGASVVQATVLALLASRQVARMTDTRAAVKIQAEWRGHAVRTSKDAEEARVELKKRKIANREREAAWFLTRAAQVFLARREVRRRGSVVRRGRELERAEEAEREADERIARMAEEAAAAVAALSDSDVRVALQPRAPNTTVPQRIRPSTAPPSRGDAAKPPRPGHSAQQRPKPPSSAGTSRTGSGTRIAGMGSRPVAWQSLRSGNWTPSPRRQYNPTADVSLDL
eukprot:Hpha_TRINITY_DN15123_c3_g5::TRINITY_DN15123_c3_g5_i1::g.127395::m.127395